MDKLPIPFEKMVCDSDRGDGGVFFYDEYFEWLERGNGRGFRIWYKAIDDIKVIMSSKKKIIVSLKGGQVFNLYLYKYEKLLEILYRKIDEVNGKKDERVVDTEDDLSKLERLAKLHESGALTDEEFKEAKQKILGK